MKNAWSTSEAVVTLGPFEDMRVKCDYFPGAPGRMYLSNGDPGYPDEPAELYITHVKVGDKWIGSEEFDAPHWLEKAEQSLLETIGDDEREEA